jgi:hypothetical protein
VIEKVQNFVRNHFISSTHLISSLSIDKRGKKTTFFYRFKRTYVTISRTTLLYQASFICCYKQQIKLENYCTYMLLSKKDLSSFFKTNIFSIDRQFMIAKNIETFLYLQEIIVLFRCYSYLYC